MGAITDVIEVVRDRLEAETAPAKLLETVKNVFIGKRQNVDFSVDCPFLVITLDSTSESFSGQNRKTSDVSISVTIIDRLVDEKSKNLYFNTLDDTGILPLAETVLDVIHQTAAGKFDPRLDQNSFTSMDVSMGGVEKFGEGFLAITANLTLKTREFIGNQRRV